MAANPQDAIFHRGTGTGQRRPPHVKFGRRSKFDQRLTEKNGRSSYIDEDCVTITSPDGGVTLTKPVDEWFKEIERDFVNYAQWTPIFKAMYRDWKEAHSAAKVDGTHIANWPLLSPAQVENLLSANIKTIEQVSMMTDEIAATIDGGSYIRSKARYWINAAADLGGVTAESASLKADNDTLRAALAHKDQQLDELKAEVKRLTDYFTGKDGFDVVAGRVRVVPGQSVGPPGAAPLPQQAPAAAETPPQLPEHVVLSYEDASTLSMAELRDYCYERNIKPSDTTEKTLEALLAANEIKKPKPETEDKKKAKRGG